MSAVIIDGSAIAQGFRQNAALAVEEAKKRGVRPCLAVILVGTDPASVSYVTGKEKALAECGMESRDFRLSGSTNEVELLALIARLNDDAAVHGILVQLPLPASMDERKIILAIKPEKDVDGFHPLNAGKLLTGQKGFVPCTPRGVLELLKASGIPTSGAHAVIVGRSNLVGKPLAALLSQRPRNATVTICHTATRGLAAFTKTADILIAAAGKPGLITADMVCPGATVIDVGVSRVPDVSKKSGFRLAGDVDFENVREVASFITPVPRGVGPMTIAMLVQNTLEAAQCPHTEPQSHGAASR
jgi:methylenetetrahydrofolate dehydrogenase (NADP+)/methenyltetrahydrofolate cyclohydrolase